MKIAVTSVGTDKNSLLEPRFGRANYFVIYDTETNEYSSVDNTAVTETAHGAGPQTAQKIYDSGVQVVLTGNGPGKNAFQVLEAGNIRMFVCKDNIDCQQVIKLYQDGKLQEFKN